MPTSAEQPAQYPPVSKEIEMADHERICAEIEAWVEWKYQLLTKHGGRPEVARTQTLTEAEIRFGADAFCVWRRQAGPDAQVAA